MQREARATFRLDVGAADYVADLSNRSYAQFLLNFDTADLIDAIG